MAELAVKAVVNKLDRPVWKPRDVAPATPVGDPGHDGSAASHVGPVGSWWAGQRNRGRRRFDVPVRLPTTA